MMEGGDPSQVNYKSEFMVSIGPGRALVFLPTLVFLGEYLACHPAAIWPHSHPNLLLIDMYENDCRSRRD
jgi:hypothetical protein